MCNWNAEKNRLTLKIVTHGETIIIETQNRSSRFHNRVKFMMCQKKKINKHKEKKVNELSNDTYSGKKVKRVAEKIGHILRYLIILQIHTHVSTHFIARRMCETWVSIMANYLSDNFSEKRACFVFQLERVAHKRLANATPMGDKQEIFNYNKKLIKLKCSANYRHKTIYLVHFFRYRLTQSEYVNPLWMCNLCNSLSIEKL